MFPLPSLDRYSQYHISSFVRAKCCIVREFYSSNYSLHRMFGNTKPRSRSRSLTRNPRQVAKWRPPVSDTVMADDDDSFRRPCYIRELPSDSFSVQATPPVALPNSFKFCVQLAHGSPMALVPSNGSIPDLFKSISTAFGIEESDIIFCTVNSFKVDMNFIFFGSLGFSDVLFVHVKGQPVEVEMTKTEAALGVTIGDNGMSRSYIKRIRQGGLAEKVGVAIRVGQLVEQINGQNVLGLRHHAVAKIIRDVPLGATFTMRLVNPLETGFSSIQPRGAKAKLLKDVGNGLETIRFKADGGAVVQQKADLPDDGLVAKLNDIFESYLGIQDNELAISLWETATKCPNLQEMIKSVRESELKVFDFPDELIFDLWGIVSDCKNNKELSGSRE